MGISLGEKLLYMPLHSIMFLFQLGQLILVTDSAFYFTFHYVSISIPDDTLSII